MATDDEEREKALRILQGHREAGHGNWHDSYPTTSRSTQNIDAGLMQVPPERNLQPQETRIFVAPEAIVKEKLNPPEALFPIPEAAILARTPAVAGLTPVTLEQLVGKADASSVFSLEIAQEGVKAFIRQEGKEAREVLVTGPVAETILKNGLDVGASEKGKSFFVKLDLNTGIHEEGNQLVIHGSQGRNIAASIGGGYIAGVDGRMKDREQAYMNIRSAGGNDPAIEEKAAASALNVRIAEAKHENMKSNSMARKLDINKDGRLGQDELALLDGDRDGRISADEVKPVERALATALANNPELAAQLANLRNGSGENIDIASIGNVAVPLTEQQQRGGRGPARV